MQAERNCKLMELNSAIIAMIISEWNTIGLFIRLMFSSSHTAKSAKGYNK